MMILLFFGFALALFIFVVWMVHRAVQNPNSFRRGSDGAAHDATVLALMNSGDLPSQNSHRPGTHDSGPFDSGSHSHSLDCGSSSSDGGCGCSSSD